MTHVLKLADRRLFRFEMSSEGRDVAVRMLDDAPASWDLLPVDWLCREERDRAVLERDLASWLKHRAIPAHRAYVGNFLSRLGLSERDVVGIMELSKGLSLNDSYWIEDEAAPASFADVNLYDNRFSNVIAHMAFTGTGSRGIPGYSTSPEFTTNGAYAKCWRRIDGGIYLFKEGSVGAANSGGEPYAEYYASNLAASIGIDAVAYVPARWKGHFCSKCALFTSKDVSFVSAGRLVRDGGIEAVARFCDGLGREFREAFADMVMFDALICNTDRHLGNFGFLVDSRESRIIAPAPLFDHGCSLLYQAMRDDFQDIEVYAATQRPCLYEDFIEVARAWAGPAQREKARRALGFAFGKHVRYNWPEWRLRGLETIVRERARLILK